MASVSRLHLNRYRQIVTVLAKNGFGLFLRQAGIFRALHLRPHEIYTEDGDDTEHKKAPLTAGVRLRRVCETLGPTFVKIGQLLSTRPDLLPAEVIFELEKLQQSVSPIPWQDIESVLYEAFGKPPTEVYASIDKKPLASASISQVHTARLISGQQVAVKVQRPGIEAQIKIDLDILKDIAGLLDRHTSLGEQYDFLSMVAELETALLNELDFISEGENADRFRKNFAADTSIHFPEIRWVYTTRCVLTMELINGISINQVEQLKAAECDCSELALRLSRTLAQQMLRDGFFHADPHPGNLLVMKDGKLAFIDLGQVGRLSASRRRILSDMLVGMANNDGGMVVEAIIALDTMKQRSMLHRFRNDINQLLERYLELPIEEIKVGELLLEIFELARKYHVRIPGELALVAKMLVTLEGIVEKLDNSLDLLTIMKPITKNLLRESFNPRDQYRRLLSTASAYETLIREAPGSALNFLRKLEDDDYTIYLDLKNRKALHHQLNQIFNRLAFAMVLLAVSIIIAGIIIGSSIMANTDASALLINSFVLRSSILISALIVAGLIVSMIRGRKMK